MSKMKIIALVLAVVLVVALAVSAAFMRYLDLEYRSLLASTSKGEALFPRTLLEEYGEDIIKNLQKQDVQLAIVSRSGQPRQRLPEGILFTHSAFWIKNGESYDVYNLYHGETNRLVSSLVTDTPADFLRLTREHDVGILIPKPEVQNRLAMFIQSPAYAKMHQKNYSLISNPFDMRYQNCNEFMLDALGAFAWHTTNISEIKNRLKTFFKPTEIKAGFVRRHIAPLVDERLVMKDQGQKIITTTRADLAEFLDHENMLDRDYILDLKPGAEPVSPTSR